MRSFVLNLLNLWSEDSSALVYVFNSTCLKLITVDSEFVPTEICSETEMKSTPPLLNCLKTIKSQALNYMNLKKESGNFFPFSFRFFWINDRSSKAKSLISCE